MNKQVNIIAVLALSFLAFFSVNTFADQATEKGSTGSAYLYPIKTDTNAFDAARLAAQYAKKDPNNAARIVAETAKQISANTEDLALILKSVMQALNIVDLKKQEEFIAQVESLTGVTIPMALLQQTPAAVRPTSPENNNDPSNPSGAGDMDNPGTVTPGFEVSPN